MRGGASGGTPGHQDRCGGAIVFPNEGPPSGSRRLRSGTRAVSRCEPDGPAGNGLQHGFLQEWTVSGRSGKERAAPGRLGRDLSTIIKRLFVLVRIVSPHIRRSCRISHRTCYGNSIDSVDAQRLLHRIALVPNENVIAGEFGGPFGCEGADTLRCHTIDVVIKNRPRIAFIQWV